jgi:hypothetical protein
MRFPPYAVLSRRTQRVVIALTLACGVLAVGACSSDRLTAPPIDAAPASAPRTNDLILSTPGGTLVGKRALLRNTPISQPITRSITLYQSGGTLRIPETGLTLTIPRNAIGNNPITITATALPGRSVAYSFEPHGTRFLNNLTLTQDLANTSWEGNAGRVVLGGGYFQNDYQISTMFGFALLNEQLPVMVTGGRVHMNINHFSGYMVSMD